MDINKVEFFPRTFYVLNQVKWMLVLSENVNDKKAFLRKNSSKVDFVLFPTFIRIENCCNQAKTCNLHKKRRN